MRYLVAFPNGSDARSESARVAREKGCGRNPEDITRFWYPVIEHPTLKSGAMEVEDDYPAPTGKSKMTRAEMKAAGWINE